MWMWLVDTANSLIQGITNFHVWLTLNGLSGLWNRTFMAVTPRYLSTSWPSPKVLAPHVLEWHPLHYLYYQPRQTINLSTLHRAHPWKGEVAAGKEALYSYLYTYLILEEMAFSSFYLMNYNHTRSSIISSQFTFCSQHLIQINISTNQNILVVMFSCS